MGEQKVKAVVENENESEQSEPDYGEVVDSPKPIVKGSSDADVGVPVVKVEEGAKPTTREIVDNANKAISDIESGRNIDLSTAGRQLLRRLGALGVMVQAVDTNLRAGGS